MQTQWTRLFLYIALGLTLFAVLFPPFTINDGLVEYGFLLSGPPSVNAYMAQVTAMSGPDGRTMLSGMFHYSLDFIRLFVELAAIWGAYVALKRTVLKPIVI